MTMVWTQCYFWLAPLPPLPNNAVTLLTTSTLSTSPESDLGNLAALCLIIYIFILALAINFKLRIEKVEKGFTYPSLFKNKPSLYLRKKYAHRCNLCTLRCTHRNTHQPSNEAAAECLAFYAAVIDSVLTHPLNLRLSSLTGNCPLMVNYML